MFISKKKWKLPRDFYQSGDINDHIIKNRGYDQALEQFLQCTEEQLLSPYAMKGMKKAVARIQSAIDNREKIIVYGDYDADGVTATSLLYLTLQTLGAEVDYYIPNRFTEGYGLNQEAIDIAYKSGVSLMITVDTGISAVAEVAIANSHQIDVVITDHHEPPEQIPDAYVILNPKYSMCEYPERNLAGVGVAFKLATALCGRIPHEYLDIVALGTVADLVPLLGENRILVSLGLQKINSSANIGIKALLEVAGLEDKEITASHLGFQLGPRINAGGRLDTAEYAIRLLIARDYGQALEIAEQLNAINNKRQELVEQTFLQAEEKLLSDPAYLENNNVIILADERWNHGIIGIVASRIVEKYYRPVIIIALEGTYGKGSARSIQGFHMFEALQACDHILERYGGHSMAAGLTISSDRQGELQQSLNQLAAEMLSPDDYISSIMIDAVLNIPEIIKEQQQIERIESLGPFGIGNSRPKVLISGATCQMSKWIGKEGNHLKFTFITQGTELDAIAFRWMERIESAECIDDWRGIRFDLVGELGVNTWMRVTKPQLTLHDCKVSPLQFVYSREEVQKIERCLQPYGLKVKAVDLGCLTADDMERICERIYFDTTSIHPMAHQEITVFVTSDCCKQVIPELYRLPQRTDFTTAYKLAIKRGKTDVESWLEECKQYGLTDEYIRDIPRIAFDFITTKYIAGN